MPLLSVIGVRLVMPWEGGAMLMTGGIDMVDGGWAIRPALLPVRILDMWNEVLFSILDGSNNAMAEK